MLPLMKMGVAVLVFGMLCFVGDEKLKQDPKGRGLLKDRII